MNQPLFREQALRQQGERLWGELLLAQPLSWRLLGIFLALLSFSCLLLLARGSYARKQAVAGQLVPEQGLIEVQAPANGLLARLLVQAGQQVEAGTPLFMLDQDTRLENGSRLGGSLRAELARQLALLQGNSQTLRQEAGLRAGELERRVAALRQGLEELELLLATGRQQLALRDAALRRANDLQQRGLLARADHDAVLAQLLQQRATVAEYGLRREQLRESLIAVQAEQELLALQYGRELRQVETELAEARKQQLQLRAGESQVVVAPVSGRVGQIARQQGMQVGAGQNILTLVPLDTGLEAELLVPSGAIAFLAPGQRVNLRLEDFPYQKFGVQEASIRAVPTTMAVLDGSGRQPFYRVSASLQQQYVLAYGREQGLLPGMALSASIVLEERSLLEWLLEPLFSIVGRS